MSRFVQELADKPPFAFIDWLEAQPIFPKFYWQSRDTVTKWVVFRAVIHLYRARALLTPRPREGHEHGVDVL